MGPRLVRLLPLLALALAGCGEHLAGSESIASQLKDANMHSNDGTSVARQSSLRKVSDGPPRA